MTTDGEYFRLGYVGDEARSLAKTGQDLSDGVNPILDRIDEDAGIISVE